MTLQERVFTVAEFEQFVALPENKNQRFELIHGTIVEKPMPTEEHGLVVARIVTRLTLYVDDHNLGRVVVETAYRAQDDDLNRRIPDVSFTSKDRALPVTRKGAVPQLPDLAIEVKSPDDTYAEMREKADYYLRNGARLVWLMFPDTERVEVHAADGTIITLEKTDTLDGGTVLPEFKLPLTQIFK